MSAKHSKKSAKKASADVPATPVTPGPTQSPAASSGAVAATAEAAPAWVDSTDPRKRTLGKVVLVGVWLYVAALWLLALDQTFNWGIFGPKIPPIP